MKLIYTKTEEEFEAEITLATDEDLRNIHESDEFDFEWYAERVHSIYVIKPLINPKILGVISLQDFPTEFRLHISLIEVSLSNQCKKKKIERIAGCLIAFAANISFRKQYFGFVSLTPKTEIIDWYMKKYGFRQFGRQLAIEGNISQNLRKTYLL